ncbi:MAG: Ran GTPase-activating protein (RanGAP) involved in mRNA processing and transport, partial [Pirellulaceae bacterium]
KPLSSFSELEWLELSGNNIDTIGIRALVEAKLKNLRVLQLQANNIDDSTIDTILASGLIKQLIGLDIRHNSVTEKGLNALAQHPDASDNLRVFIENNQISDTLQASILRRFPKRFQRMGWPEHPRNYD